MRKIFNGLLARFRSPRPKLYYSLQFSTPVEVPRDRDSWFTVSLRIESAHPFPSPVGTYHFLTMEDEFWDAGVQSGDHGYGDSSFSLEVLSLEDRDGNFYMHLGFPNEESPEFELIHARLVADILQRRGWEKD